MAYGTPADPVAGTVITVAYAVANLLDPIRALRAFTGGADPPGSGYVVTSDSTSATTWKTLAAAVVAGAGGTPVITAGSTLTGDLTFNGNGVGVLLGGNGGTGRSNVDDLAGVGLRLAAHNDQLIVLSQNLGTTMLTVTPTVATFVGNIQALAASLTSVATSGAAAIGTTLGVTGTITTASTVQGTQLISTVATGTAPLTVASTTEVANLNAAALSSNDWFAPVTVSPSADYTPGSSFGNVTNCTHTVAAGRGGTYEIGFHCYFRRNGTSTGTDPNQFRARIQRAGSGTTNSKEAHARCLLIDTSHTLGIAAATIAIAANAGDTITLQAIDTEAGGNTVEQDYTWMTVAWQAP